MTFCCYLIIPTIHSAHFLTLVRAAWRSIEKFMTNNHTETHSLTVRCEGCLMTQHVRDQALYWLELRDFFYPTGTVTASLPHMV